jgi:4'-phosphopantetheinyl transferase
MDTHPVELWTFPLTREVPTHLSEDEVARANRFRFEQDRVRWIRARSSLRMILSRYTGEDPGNLGFSYGKHGKPTLSPFTEVQFNLSHAGDWAIVAVTESVPVGVDIERIRNDVDIAALLLRLDETDLPESIPDLFSRWTRREAKTKAAGGALFDKPSDDTGAIDITAPAGYSASIALLGYQPFVTYRTLP